MTPRAIWFAAAAVSGLAALFLALKPASRDVPRGTDGAVEFKPSVTVSTEAAARPPTSLPPAIAAKGRASVPVAEAAAQSTFPPNESAESDRTTLAHGASLGPPSSPDAGAIEFDFVVVGNQVRVAPKALRIQRGQMVRIRILADRNDTLHVHGYDHKLKLKAGRHSELSFDANTAGRFGLELHHPELELGALEVSP